MDVHENVARPKKWMQMAIIRHTKPSASTFSTSGSMPIKYKK